MNFLIEFLRRMISWFGDLDIELKIKFIYSYEQFEKVGKMSQVRHRRTWYESK